MRPEAEATVRESIQERGYIVLATGIRFNQHFHVGQTIYDPWLEDCDQPFRIIAETTVEDFQWQESIAMRHGGKPFMYPLPRQIRFWRAVTD